MLPAIPVLLEGLAAGTPLVATTVMREAGKGIAFSIGGEVIFETVAEGAAEAFADWFNTNAGEIKSVGLDAIPQAVQRSDRLEGSTEDSIWDNITDWVEDEFDSAVNRLEGEIVDIVQEELVLDFGYACFNREGIVSRPSRGIDNQLQKMLAERNNPTHKDMTSRLKIGNGHIFMDTGLTIIMAASGQGKSTLVEGMARTLLNRTGDDNVRVGYLSWGERDHYSMNGAENHFVGHMEDLMSNSDVVLLDSVRLMTTVKKGAAGSKGLNTLFFTNLTQWHHEAIDRNVALFVVVNPVIEDKDFTDTLKEIVRGATNGILHIERRGSYEYEHVRSGRTPESFNYDVNWFESSDPIPGIGSKGGKSVEQMPTIDMDPEAGSRFASFTKTKK
jgi:hypothetical protein